MIQDIFPMHLENAYENKKPAEGSLITAFRENEIFVKIA